MIFSEYLNESHCFQPVIRLKGDLIEGSLNLLCYLSSWSPVSLVVVSTFSVEGHLKFSPSPSQNLKQDIKPYMFGTPSKFSNVNFLHG